MSMEPTSDPAVGRPFRLLAGRRKWVILLGVLLLGAIGATLWQNRTAPGGDVGDSNTATSTTTNVGLNQTSSDIKRVTVPLTADADKDGLPDQRETELGTNMKLADSDGDGLNDYEEVEVYATDPRQQDTDRDGFPDGDEVRTGNNPNGPGAARDLPQTLSNINAQ